MSKVKTTNGVVLGYVTMVVMGLAITGLSLSVWAKPYTSAKDTAITIVTDTTKTVVVTENLKSAIAGSTLVDTLAINAIFLQKMHEKGELLSSDEFASRITGYYNTLVAVLTALFVLFTLVTYITFKSKFEGKFEDKAKEFEEKAINLENKQRQKIVEELRGMLSDSKKIDEVIQTAIGGRIDDNVATHEEVDDLSNVVETNGKNIATLMSFVDDVKKKQQELFKVVADLQDQVAEGATVQQAGCTAEEFEQGQEEETETKK